MLITITTRHCDIPEDLRARAHARLERLAQRAPRSHRFQLIFSAEHGRPSVELQLHTNRRQVHFAIGDGVDHRTALDRAVAKLRRQMSKTPVRRAPARKTR